jgi:predicted ATP-dependent serine protease
MPTEWDLSDKKCVTCGHRTEEWYSWCPTCGEYLALGVTTIKIDDRKRPLPNGER